jgi:hypothetical protein
MLMAVLPTTVLSSGLIKAESSTKASTLAVPSSLKRPPAQR